MFCWVSFFCILCIVCLLFSFIFIFSNLVHSWHHLINWTLSCVPNRFQVLHPVPIMIQGVYRYSRYFVICCLPEPQSVELRIEGQTDKCSKNEDINFQFTGFGIVGKVKCVQKLQMKLGTNATGKNLCFQQNHAIINIACELFSNILFIWCI